MATTDDRLLGGRVHLRQPLKGYRAAIDPVFLAAAVPAGPGDSVLDLGTGPGAAALCLAVRTGCAVTGIELDPAAVTLARENAVTNAVRFTVIAADIADPATSYAGFDHAMANPPFLDEGQGTPPPNLGKRAANMAASGAVDRWVDLAVRAVRPGGTVTFVYRADQLPGLLAAFPDGAAGVAVFPLWRRAGDTAERVLVQARAGGRAPFQLLAGLVLHESAGPYTRAAEAVLRGGSAIDLMAD